MQNAGDPRKLEHAAKNNFGKSAARFHLVHDAFVDEVKELRHATENGDVALA